MDHKQALDVFSRLYGMESPAGVFAVYNPERGWCRSIKHLTRASSFQWCWSKKAKHIEVEVKAIRLVSRLKVTIPVEITIVDLLTLKTWKPAAFIAEFGKKPRVFKMARGKCPRCNREVALRGGKPIKNAHWCWCQQCKQCKECKPGCPHHIAPVILQLGVPNIVP